MRPLPILWGHKPTAGDWALVKAAKLSSGYKGLVQPASAVLGSPGRILVVGVLPDWACEGRWIASCADPELPEILRLILMDLPDPKAFGPEHLLSKWMGVEVTANSGGF